MELVVVINTHNLFAIWVVSELVEKLASCSGFVVLLQHAQIRQLLATINILVHLTSSGCLHKEGRKYIGNNWLRLYDRTIIREQAVVHNLGCLVYIDGIRHFVIVCFENAIASCCNEALLAHASVVVCRCDLLVDEVGAWTLVANPACTVELTNFAHFTC